MKAAVIVFPGSNYDKDCQRAFHAVTGVMPDRVWHKETSLEGYDTVFLPGGFSYGVTISVQAQLLVFQQLLCQRWSQAC